MCIIASIIKKTQNKNGDRNSEKIMKILVFSTYSWEGKSVQPYYNQEAK